MPALMKLSSNLEPIIFSQIPNWSNDDHFAAFRCFLQSAKRIVEKPYSTKLIGVNANEFKHIASKALSHSITNNEKARAFFETHFSPHKFTNTKTGNLLTGYFEPQVEASTVPTTEFCHPLYRRPDDLADLNDDNRPPGLDASFMFGRKDGASVTEYFDRKQIQNGALVGRGLELFWLRDPADIFFIHIQGSARLRLENGETTRVSYAAKSGHPYTPIGKILVESGELDLADVTMQTIRDWMSGNPEKQLDLMAENRSYIFFRKTDQTDPKLGPVAAAGVPLTAGRSLAIDHKLHTFGTPIWVENDNSFSRLLIAQDTGSAIVGEQRGDLFIGSGTHAGQIAGAMKTPISMVLLVPRSVADAQ